MRTVIASKKPAWITLAVALVFHTLLLSVQTNKRFDTSFVRVWLLDSLGPFEKVVDVSVEGVENIWTGYIGLIHVHRDNQRAAFRKRPAANGTLAEVRRRRSNSPGCGN